MIRPFLTFLEQTRSIKQNISRENVNRFVYLQQYVSEFHLIILYKNLSLQLSIELFMDPHRSLVIKLLQNTPAADSSRLASAKNSKQHRWVKKLRPHSKVD